MKKELPFEIVYADEMDKNHESIIIEAFNKDAREKKGLEGDIKSFSFSCFDKDKNFIAGISGMSSWGGFYIRSLFVNEDIRDRNYGTLLIEKAEDLARERGCNFIHLITMDWQAKPFYEKLGYKVEFTRHGYEKDSILYSLRKDL
ncbi:GNAT family N-acetyltransferase [Rickettsia endosymbiont of Orchestes rusci]|uniref:GNAT family N-acetyltransferase n=1 Tax=Rickettsia endosymbiont of Orchestes rusci TaxID=3066250 RepID=UPI00313D1C5B